jgi:succinoglycan biosynthesis protein ExoM
MKDHISVCICTFHRNQMLARLLTSLKSQETDGLFEYSVVVIDNDQTGPAREIVLGLKASLSLEIAYDIEPEQTIPAARNHAIQLARGNYIAIIDDDEFPSERWLVTMFRAIQDYDVDGALGPIHPYFDQEPPDWLIKGRFCERPTMPTGTILDWTQTRTGNVVINKKVFEEGQIWFDLRCRTGGSDRVFFKQALQAGYRVVAVEGAPVHESVPPERWTKSYHLRRAVVGGYNAYTNYRSDIRGIRHLTIPLKSAVAAAGYIIALPFAALLGSHRLMKCLLGEAYHLSFLGAVLGIEIIKKRNF